MSLQFTRSWRWALAILATIFSSAALAESTSSLIISQPTAMQHGLKRPLLAHIDVDGSRDQLAYIGQYRNALFLQTKQGAIHEVNIENGHIEWQTQLGDAGLVGFPPAANDKFVVAVSGSHVYLLDRANKGSVVWKQGLNAAPIAGPAINDEFVYVPTYSELVEALQIDPKNKRPATSFRTTGRVTGSPVVTPKTVAFTTEEGILSVYRTTDHKSAFRFTAGGKVTSRPGYDNGTYYVGCHDGYVYALDEQSGANLWQFSAGDRVISSPAAVGTGVYITSETGGMFRVSADTGQEEWFTPNIRRFLSASKDKVYTEDKIGRLAILDSAAGGVVDTLSLAGGLNLRPANVQTDRVLLASSTGLVQALNEPELIKPLDYLPPPEVKVEEKPKIEKLGNTVQTATAGAASAPKAAATPKKPLEKKEKPPKPDPTTKKTPPAKK